METKVKRTFASKRRKSYPKGFMVNKLARPDRGAVDEQDMKGVFLRQAGKLDNEYLQEEPDKLKSSQYHKPSNPLNALTR